MKLGGKGTLYVTHAVLVHMVGRKYGKIINIASRQPAASATLAAGWRVRAFFM